MATELEVHDVLTYIAADLDYEITDEKRTVWFDQFKDIPFEKLWNGARLLLTQKVFGRFPRVSDMWQALADGEAPIAEQWAGSWQTWVGIYKRFGRCQTAEALHNYRQIDPIGASIMEYRVIEYANLLDGEITTFRAQFRQAYEAEITNVRKNIIHPSGLPKRRFPGLLRVNEVLKLVDLTIEKNEEK